MKAAKLWATPSRGLFICISVHAILFGPSIAMADGSGRSSRQPASKLDNLKRQPVRDGLFIGWCGSAGGFLTQQNRARFVHTPALSEPIALPSGYIMGCDANAEHVIFSDLSVHAATKIRIKDQMTNLFARFRDADRANLLISPSPDLARIAFDPGGAELDQGGNPGNVTLVPVERSATSWKSHTIAWRSDSSILFHIFERSARERVTQNPSQEIEVIDVRSGSRTTGRLPAGFGYQSPFRPNGVILANGSELMLFLRPIGASGEPEDETDCGPDPTQRCRPGTVFSCKLAPAVSCVPVMSDVDMVSMNEKGTVAAIRHTFKKPPRTDGETLLVPDVFNVEFRTRDGRTIAKQRYTSKDGLGLQIIMAPQGGKAVVNWTLRGVCGGTGPLERELCRSNSIVDFSERE